MKFNKLFAAALAALILASLVTGCSSAPGSKDTVSLDGTAWTLVRLQGQELIPETEITLEFKEGQAAGSAGCNRYFGAASIEGDKLAIGPVGNTEMFCAAPEGVMDQELAYLKALSTVARFEVEGGELVFVDGSEQTVLVFAAAAAD